MKVREFIYYSKKSTRPSPGGYVGEQPRGQAGGHQGQQGHTGHHNGQQFGVRNSWQGGQGQGGQGHGYVELPLQGERPSHGVQDVQAHTQVVLEPAKAQGDGVSGHDVSNGVPTSNMFEVLAAKPTASAPGDSQL